MKAEHRKELRTNVLADRMGRAIQTVKEGPSRGTWLLIGVAVVAVGLFLVFSLVRQHSVNVNSTLWERWSSLSEPAALEEFAKDHPGTVAGRLARFKVARLLLGQGVASLGTPAQRGEATKKIGRAGELYEQLADETTDNPHLRQEALLQAGKALETLGEVDRATQFYKKLEREYPDTAAGKDAKASIGRLEAAGKDLDTLKQLVTPKPTASKELKPTGTP
jgi:hypothetical protein